MSDPIHYGLSAASRKAGIAEPTLRRYTNAGIVKCARDSAGRRIFTEADIERARAYREQRIRT
jgi:DNA-binding transcriptional MerR regulator